MKTLTREQIIEVFGLDNPWTLKDVLNKLIEASEILLHKKNYDRHGWEEISHCVKRGKEIDRLKKLKLMPHQVIEICKTSKTN